MLDLQEKTVKEGLLLHLSVKLQGGVEYQRQDEGKRFSRDDSTLREEWRTLKTTANIKEYEKAVDLRAEIRNRITRLCARSPIGDALLVPPENESQVKTAIREAWEACEAFNRKASFTRVSVSALFGRVTADDEFTTRSIAREIRATLLAMSEAVKDANPEGIRENAKKARMAGMMLSEAAKARVGEAIDQAREAARELTRRVGKAGEQASIVVEELKTDKINAAAYSFLDLDGEAKSEKVAPVVGAVDFEVSDDSEKAMVAKSPEIDL